MLREMSFESLVKIIDILENPQNYSKKAVDIANAIFEVYCKPK